MPASLWKSLTVQFMAIGHSLHKEECIAAVIVTGCLVMYTITGYRFRDGERDRLPAVYSGPETRSTIRSGHWGSVPDGVDRDRFLLQYQREPAGPAIRGMPRKNKGERRISSAIMGPAVMMCW